MISWKYFDEMVDDRCPNCGKRGSLLIGTEIRTLLTRIFCCCCHFKERG